MPLTRKQPMPRGSIPLRKKSLGAVGKRGRRNRDADIIWRGLVNQRWDGKCVRCGSVEPVGDCWGELEHCHIYAKGGLYAHLRLVPENGVLGHESVHRWSHANPKESTAYFLSLLTPSEFARLENLRKAR